MLVLNTEHFVIVVSKVFLFVFVFHANDKFYWLNVFNTISYDLSEYCPKLFQNEMKSTCTHMHTHPMYEKNS